MLLLFEATQIKLGIIEKMPRISKDLVNHILIDEAQAGQRLDNYLIKILILIIILINIYLFL